MKLVITNDDGIAAPGLPALEQACRAWGEVTVAAPDRCHSSMSHHVNTTHPIAVTKIAAGRFQLEASPADCVRLARTHLAPDAEWLISGINRGGNLGMDTCYSGTVAAAREAALLGWPAIAISHYVERGREVDWELAALRAGRVLRHLLGTELAAAEFWNVNLPHPPKGTQEPEIVFCPLDSSPLPVSYRQEGNQYRYTGEYPARLQEHGHDVALCFGGAITATRMRAGF